MSTPEKADPPLAPAAQLLAQLTSSLSAEVRALNIDRMTAIENGRDERVYWRELILADGHSYLITVETVR